MSTAAEWTAAADQYRALGNTGAANCAERAARLAARLEAK